MEELQKQLEAAQAENKTLKSRIGVLEKDAAQDKEDLQKAADVIAELKAELSGKAAQVAQVPTVSVGKQTYEFVGGSFTYKGQVVTIDVLKDNAKLAAELVKEGVGGLRLVQKD